MCICYWDIINLNAMLSTISEDTGQAVLSQNRYWGWPSKSANMWWIGPVFPTALYFNPNIIKKNIRKLVRQCTFKRPVVEDTFSRSVSYSFYFWQIQHFYNTSFLTGGFYYVADDVIIVGKMHASNTILSECQRTNSVLVHNLIITTAMLLFLAEFSYHSIVAY
jgi:hypothetical protein